MSRREVHPPESGIAGARHQGGASREAPGRGRWTQPWLLRPRLVIPRRGGGGGWGVGTPGGPQTRRQSLAPGPAGAELRQRRRRGPSGWGGGGKETGETRRPPSASRAPAVSPREGTHRLCTDPCSPAPPPLPLRCHRKCSHSRGRRRPPAPRRGQPPWPPATRASPGKASPAPSSSRGRAPVAVLVGGSSARPALRCLGTWGAVGPREGWAACPPARARWRAGAGTERVRAGARPGCLPAAVLPAAQRLGCPRLRLPGSGSQVPGLRPRACPAPNTRRRPGRTRPFCTSARLS